MKMDGWTVQQATATASSLVNVKANVIFERHQKDQQLNDCLRSRNWMTMEWPLVSRRRIDFL